MQIKLNSMTQPEKVIHTIKALRSATSDPLTGRTGLGLKEAKDAIDTLRYGGKPEALVVTVTEITDELTDYLDFTVLSTDSDTTRIALRAAIIGVSPGTLEGLVAVLPVGHPVRIALTDASSQLRGAGG